MTAERVDLVDHGPIAYGDQHLRRIVYTHRGSRRVLEGPCNIEAGAAVARRCPNAGNSCI